MGEQPTASRASRCIRGGGYRHPRRAGQPDQGQAQAEAHLTIGGWQEQLVHTRLDAANENRIRHLQERLDALRSGLRETQAKARLTGKARGNFGRSRDGPG